MATAGLSPLEASKNVIGLHRTATLTCHMEVGGQGAASCVGASVRGTLRTLDWRIPLTLSITLLADLVARTLLSAGFVSVLSLRLLM